MSFIPPPLEEEDESDIARRAAAAADQQRRINELQTVAYDAIVKAEEAMREARRLMAFPGSSSVSWAERFRNDE